MRAPKPACAEHTWQHVCWLYVWASQSSSNCSRGKLPFEKVMGESVGGNKSGKDALGHACCTECNGTYPFASSICLYTLKSPSELQYHRSSEG